MSLRIEQYDEGEAEHTRRLELDSTEEVRVNTTLQSARYLQGLRRHYNKNTQPRSLQVGDLVLRRIQKTDGRHKLLSPWEGPFIVSKVTGPGILRMKTTQGRIHVQTTRDQRSWPIKMVFLDKICIMACQTIMINKDGFPATYVL